MPGSQLKRLKASLKEHGIVGPQLSKKQKKKAALDQKARNEKRQHKHEALENIREQFNPFQFKTNARGPKFEITANRPDKDRAARAIHGRPELTRAMREERRRKTLLVEMQQRNKVGGLIDRRFGEQGGVTPEEAAVERFTREKIRQHKKNSVFDLEQDGGEILTHMGQPLTFDDETGEIQDDFDESDLGIEEESEGSDVERKNLKRRRLEETRSKLKGEGEEAEENDEQPPAKKSNKEIMEEVIAKSKLYRYERQAIKEADEDMIDEINAELPMLTALMHGREKLPAQNDERPAKHAETAAERSTREKEYDQRVRQLANDKRAHPTERTKTNEEKALEEAERLEGLEEARLKRMAGMGEDSSEEEEGIGIIKIMGPGDVANADEENFGLGKGIKVKMRPTATELGFDDEDDFLIEDELVASGSELLLSKGENLDEDSHDGSEEEEDEFTTGLFTEAEKRDSAFQEPSKAKGNDGNGVPYVFSTCPESHEALLDAFEGIKNGQLHVAIQRIRAGYHPKLGSGNKVKLINFAISLVDHISYLGRRDGPSAGLETTIRHVHSLAKTYPIEIARKFREHVNDLARKRALEPHAGDLMILTAIGTVFPTSDHFHQVVTPAMLCMARYLGQKIPQRLGDYVTGTYLALLTLHYQRQAKRFVPELMTFWQNLLSALSPEKLSRVGGAPIHESPAGIRIMKASCASVRKLRSEDCTFEAKDEGAEAAAALKAAILDTTLSASRMAAEMWSKMPSFYETFKPVHILLTGFLSERSKKHLPAALVIKLRDTTIFLERLLRLAMIERRPLELHHHKPLAIRTFIPKFEHNGFDPTKHYDPDRERASQAKLRAEHKKERKGAMRELRRDAVFVARESLRVKRERDEAYDKKYKRLVAEIQGEEGQAANEYEREKKLRKRKR